MRTLLPVLTGSLLLASAAVAAPRVDPETKLERELRGRVAGEPVDCIQLRNIRSSRIIDRTAIVYDTGRTLYVNRPRNGQESLNDWDVLVTNTHSSRLCSIDTVQLYDSGSGMFSGVVFLGEFVPYRRP
jgi:hypothetical protein